MTDSSWAIVVVNYGSHGLLEQNLAGIDARVVVVDNYSGPQERAEVAALARREDWELLTPATNLGFGAGMNLGVAHAVEAGADVLVLINPDVRAEHDSLDALVAHAHREPLTLLSPRILRPDGRVWFAGGEVLVEQGRTITTGADSSTPNGWLTGACLTVHRDLWTRIGGFDADYFLYWEDIDLSWRVTRSGGRLVVRDDIDVVHSIGGTQHSPVSITSGPGRTGEGHSSITRYVNGKTPGKSTTYIHFNCRNRLVFAAKFLNDRDYHRWLWRSPTYARLVLLRGGRRQLLRHPIGPVLAAVRGSVEGVSAARRLRKVASGPRG